MHKLSRWLCSDRPRPKCVSPCFKHVLPAEDVLVRHEVADVLPLLLLIMVSCLTCRRAVLFVQHMCTAQRHCDE